MHFAQSAETWPILVYIMLWVMVHLHLCYFSSSSVGMISALWDGKMPQMSETTYMWAPCCTHCLLCTEERKDCLTLSVSYFCLCWTMTMHLNVDNLIPCSLHLFLQKLKGSLLCTIIIEQVQSPLGFVLCGLEIRQGSSPVFNGLSQQPLRHREEEEACEQRHNVWLFSATPPLPSFLAASHIKYLIISPLLIHKWSSAGDKTSLDFNASWNKPVNY